jgi:hypothetical protein
LVLSFVKYKAKSKKINKHLQTSPLFGEQEDKTLFVERTLGQIGQIVERAQLS